MNEWAKRRKRNILLIIVSFLIVVVALPLFFLLRTTPSCFDTKQDGDETGIDCGGSCTLLCTSDSLPLILKGDPRVLKIATSTYALIAYVENPNVQGEIARARYTFKVFDKSNPAPLKTVTGATNIPKNTSFVIFEGPFDFGTTLPARATFEWQASDLVWQKSVQTNPTPTIKDKLLTNDSGNPRLTATLTNDTLSSIFNIELVALISDENDNVISASKTFVDGINPGDSKPLVWSWPTAFTGKALNVEIVPHIYPDSSFIH